jgi:hypothetical protein
MLWKNTQEYTPERVYKLVSIIKKYITDFAPLNDAKFAKLRAAVPILWTDAQIVATFQSLMSHQSMIASQNVSKITDTVTTNNLLHLSNTYRVNPLAIVRHYLTKCGYPKTLIHNWLNYPINITDDAIYDLVVLAWNSDSESPALYKAIGEQARLFEVDVEWLLKKMNLKFKTQEDLVVEQTAEHGRAIITPDILFAEPVKLLVTHPNGVTTTHMVNWIDAKNYLLININFMIAGLKKQAAKYCDKFGPGAFLFHYGFVNNIIVDNTVMLSMPNIKA